MSRYISRQYKDNPILGINGMRLMGMRSGVGRAMEAILRELDNIDHPFREIRVYSPQPIDRSIYLPKGARNVVVKSILPKGLWEQFTLPKAHGRLGPLFCPSYVAPIFAKCPVVLTHHGSYEGYPGAFPWWTEKKAFLINRLSARSADALSTVSSHSRRDIEKFYGVPQNRVSVIPEGVDTRIFRYIDNEATKAAWRTTYIGSDAPIILYVGKATKRRNLGNLMTAFAKLKRQNNLPHKLVLIGTSLPGASLESEIRSNSYGDDIISIGFAEPAEIAIAYNCADLLVYPSSYEGFGMPVLEAMACGAPTIALNNTAFPEFSSGVACLLEDAEPDTLAAAILELSTNAAHKKRIRTMGPERAAQYDWRCLVPAYVDLICRACGLPDTTNQTISNAVIMASSPPRNDITL